MSPLNLCLEVTGEFGGSKFENLRQGNLEVPRERCIYIMISPTGFEDGEDHMARRLAAL